jgi:hypothetical protein
VSAQVLEAGQTGAVELTLPRLALMPNRLLLWVWFGPVGPGISYDCIDANVDLPPLTIRAEGKDRKLHGAVFIEHELRKIEIKGPVAALVT